jgi:hypothetical protein
MNTPFSPEGWHQLREHAAAQLSPSFADNVLRAARQDPSAGSAWSSPFLVSAATAALCFFLVVFFHAQATDAATSRNLADWDEITLLSASFEPNP